MSHRTEGRVGTGPGSQTQPAAAHAQKPLTWTKKDLSLKAAGAFFLFQSHDCAVTAMEGSGAPSRNHAPPVH